MRNRSCVEWREFGREIIAFLKSFKFQNSVVLIIFLALALFMYTIVNDSRIKPTAKSQDFCFTLAYSLSLSLSYFLSHSHCVCTHIPLFTLLSPSFSLSDKLILVLFHPFLHAHTHYLSHTHTQSQILNTYIICTNILMLPYSIYICMYIFTHEISYTYFLMHIANMHTIYLHTHTHINTPCSLTHASTCTKLLIHAHTDAQTHTHTHPNQIKASQSQAVLTVCRVVSLFFYFFLLSQRTKEKPKNSRKNS